MLSPLKRAQRLVEEAKADIVASANGTYSITRFTFVCFRYSQKHFFVHFIFRCAVKSAKTKIIIFAEFVPWA